MTDEGRLFELPPLPPAEPAMAWNPLKAGTAAEHLLVARLLLRNHSVAVPIVDDGVDVIVNHRICVQVKSTDRRIRGDLKVDLVHSAGWTWRTPGAGSGRTAPNATTGLKPRTGKRAELSPIVDVVAVYGRDSDHWWFIPRAQFAGRRSLTVSEQSGSEYHRGFEAWDIFGEVEDAGSGSESV